MEELLRGLALTEGGLARLANLADGLAAEHITPAALAEIMRQADVLRQRAQESPEADFAYEAYSLLRDAFLKVQEQLYFRRPKPPSGDMRVALVIPHTVFVGGGGFQLFSPKYRNEAEETGKLPIEPITTAGGVADLLQFIRDGLHSGIEPGVGLGNASKGAVVFLTAVDAGWEALTRSRIRGIKPGDPWPQFCDGGEILDRLGLPHSGCWLIELRSRIRLRDVLAEGQAERWRAPTVIEAWAHHYYRHWPAAAVEERWGRTLHLADLRARKPEANGLPEAIIDHFSGLTLAKHFDVAILAKITTREIPPLEDVAFHLAGKRTEDDFVQIIGELARRLRAMSKQDVH